VQASRTSAPWWGQKELKTKMKSEHKERNKGCGERKKEEMYNSSCLVIVSGGDKLFRGRGTRFVVVSARRHRILYSYGV
jgi:hypothetical protein